MTSRRLSSPFAAWLAYVFSVLLLIGVPVRPLPASTPMQAGEKSALVVAMADDVHDDADSSGPCSLDDNTSGGMDDILHPFDTAHLWAPMPVGPPLAGAHDVGPHAPSRLLRPPEVA
ncbi:hypothetical protein [Dyella jiangningensis]|uniref:Uncharacterized protein n=1 Tax=Dyella jiangningensis TaxID=1379159 RepID=A0A328P651_9GAMM|nr:hypothetical protein [Dyella jiangningensis]RAO77747.1 hypothetical protein CA260_07780 [Dyella jiangningensis]